MNGFAKEQLVRVIEGKIWRALGRHYQIHFDLLDVRSLGELARLLRDLETEQLNAARRAQLHPWRR
jgi:hypothetical protein